MVKVDTCIPEVELNDYLNGVIPEKRRSEIEVQLENCNARLEKLVFAYKTVWEFNKIKKVCLPARLTAKPWADREQSPCRLTGKGRKRRGGKDT